VSIRRVGENEQGDMIVGSGERRSILPASRASAVGWPWSEETPAEWTPAGGRAPRISIVTPSYNQAEYLEETIRSVLLQGYPDCEYIVIDGASTDGSVACLRRYEPWLACWVSEPDGGQSNAINKGFVRAGGDLVTFQNSDDIYLPGAFQHVADAWNSIARKDEVGAIVGGFVFMNAKSRFIETPIPAFVSTKTPADFSLGIEYRLHQVSTFYTRHALEAVGMHVREDLHYTMDRELLYRVAKRYRIHIIPEVLAAFRVHAGSKSVSAVLPFSREFADLHLSFLDGIARNDRLRKRAARRHLSGGFLRIARLETRRVRAIASLARALRHEPSLLLTKMYWARCAAAVVAHQLED
jgi:glycosyltransferase involved in cell wall biosynthesis